MGRPPKTSREEILSAAAGFSTDQLQLTLLAQELGLSVKTIYYYFPNRRALLDALTERAVAELGLPDLSGSRTWREVLTETAQWTFHVARSEPSWRPDAATPRGVALEVIRRVRDRLVELGWPDRDAFRALMILIGWAWSVGEAAARTPVEPVTDLTEQLRDYADPGVVSDLVQHLSALTPDDLFTDGLRVLLAGIDEELCPR